MGEVCSYAKRQAKAPLGTGARAANLLSQETTIMTVIRLIMGASLVLYALSSAA